LKGLLKFVAVIFLSCALFIIVDVEHRVDGYQAVHGQGIVGTVTVTGCEKHRTGTFCIGDFSSADGRILRPEVRVNGAVELLGWSEGDGPPTGSVRLPSALTAADADEAWTLDGVPWLRPSVVQITALLPVAAVVTVLWGLLREGPRGWRYRRMRRGRMPRGGVVRREMAMARMSRRGRVHLVLPVRPVEVTLDGLDDTRRTVRGEDVEGVLCARQLGVQHGRLGHLPQPRDEPPGTVDREQGGGPARCRTRAVSWWCAGTGRS
jgi:hypothetical protein